jgi:hypothetical protein
LPPASPAERWQALYGTRPPARSQALIAAALIHAEQVKKHGDVPPAIQHDLAILAHQLRVARLSRQASTDGLSNALPMENNDSSVVEASVGGATSAPDDAYGASHAISGPNGASHAICADTELGVTRQNRVQAPDLPPPASRRRALRVPQPMPPATSQLMVGARLVKVHGGVTHVVDVTAEGMRYDGQLFASLSAVAKHITGTHWNGLLFFGLRRRKTYPPTRAHG